MKLFSTYEDKYEGVGADYLRLIGVSEKPQPDEDEVYLAVSLLCRV
jgi:hypothetical protein